MEDLMNIEEALIECINGHLENIAKVNTHELGEVIDMIKDIEQAMYYRAMAEKKEG